MGAAESIRLEGKDWFREPEAAEYCGMCRRSFQDWAKQAGMPSLLVDSLSFGSSTRR